MRFGIRQSFDAIRQFESRYRECRLPIELALPYKMDDYDRVRPQLHQLASQLRGVRRCSPPDREVVMSYYSQHERLPLPEGQPTPSDIFLA